MDDMKDLLGSEYYNTSDLMGVDDPADLLGRIARLPKEQQGRAVKKLMQKTPATVTSSSSRLEMEQRFMLLPAEIRDGLMKKRLQLVDTRFYIVKDVSAKNAIDVFQGTDDKGVGLSSVANQKLEKDNWFIISAIKMIYGEAVGGMMVVDYSHIHTVIRNGEFELEAGTKKLVGLMGCECFDTRNRADLPTGFYKLENTKIIEPQVEIKMPVKFTAAANANAFLKVVFIGTSVKPY